MSRVALSLREHAHKWKCYEFSEKSSEINISQYMQAGVSIGLTVLTIFTWEEPPAAAELTKEKVNILICHYF